MESVVADVMADMKANGETIPEALATSKYSGKILVHVPPEVHRNLVMEATEEHISLNRLVNAKLAY